MRIKQVTPERKAREEIDHQLAACGRTAQDFNSMKLGATPAVAVRE